MLDRNELIMDDPSFWRSFGPYHAAASGMSVGTEHWYPQLIDVVNVSYECPIFSNDLGLESVGSFAKQSIIVRITNNLCVGVSRCVGGYSMGHHSSGVRVEGNTAFGVTV